MRCLDDGAHHVEVFLMGKSRGLAGRSDWNETVNARLYLKLHEFAQIVVSDGLVFLKRGHERSDRAGKRAEFHGGFTGRYLAQQSTPLYQIRNVFHPPLLA